MKRHKCLMKILEFHQSRNIFLFIILFWFEIILPTLNAQVIKAQSNVENSSSAQLIEAQSNVENSFSAQLIEAQSNVENSSSTQLIEAQSNVENSSSVQLIEAQSNIKNSSSAQLIETQSNVENSSSAQLIEAQSNVENSSSAQLIETQSNVENSSSAQLIESQSNVENISSAQLIEAQSSVENSSSAQLIEAQSNVENSSSAQLLNGTQIGLSNSRITNASFFFNFTESLSGLSIINQSYIENSTVGYDNYLHNISSKQSSHNTDQQTIVSDWWIETEREVNEMLIHVKNCPDWKYKCFYNESSRTSSQKRECDCDSTCRRFGECCIDQAAVTSSSPTEKNRDLFCGQLNLSPLSNGILMIGKCPESMLDTFEDDYCNMKVPFDSYEVILDIPVVSLRTNYTYRNYYCAICNDDSDHLLQIDMAIHCNLPKNPKIDANTTITNFLMNSKYKRGQRRFERNENTEIDETSKSEAKSSEPVMKPKIPIIHYCNLEIKQFKNIERFSLSYNNSRICTFPENSCVTNQPQHKDCIKQIRTCNSSWPVPSDFVKCSSYTLKVFDKTNNILYKNPHCTKCNFSNMTSKQFVCSDLSIADPGVIKVPYPKPTFSMLFKIPNWKCENHDEIWFAFTRKCSPIVCGSGRFLEGGKCVESKDENLEDIRNDFPNSTIQNDCPKVAIENFTIYENESVYSFLSQKTYEKGNYELHNDSVLLICVEDSYYYEEFSLLHYYTTVAVLGVSLLCLTFHIILYFRSNRMRTWHGKNLLCLCCSLFIAQFLSLTGITATDNFGFCVFMSVCLHYFWLASFCWMNVLSIDVWKTFNTLISPSSTKKKKLFMYYSLYSWGFPLAIVSISLILDLTTHLRFRPLYAGISRNPTLCWINSKLGLLYLFLLPVGIIILKNLIFYLITSYKICVQSKEAQFAQHKTENLKQGKEKKSDRQSERMKTKEIQNKIRFGLYLKLGILQGMMWLTGFLATFINSSLCWYIFTILNGLQGAVIVLCFDIKKWVFISMRESISQGPLSRFSKSTKSTFRRANHNGMEKIDQMDGTKKDKEKNIKLAKNEMKVLTGQYSINLPLQQRKINIIKRISCGSYVGYKRNQVYDTVNEEKIVEKTEKKSEIKILESQNSLSLPLNHQKVSVTKNVSFESSYDYKRDQIDDILSNKEEEIIEQTKEKAEIKYFLGQHSINIPFKRHKVSVTKNVSWGSSVGYERDQIDNTKNTNEAKFVEMTKVPNDKKILKGQYSINLPSKCYKISVAKKFSCGSSVGYKRYPKPNEIKTVESNTNTIEIITKETPYVFTNEAFQADVVTEEQNPKKYQEAS